MGAKRKRIIGNAIIYFILICAFIIIVFPVFYTFMGSFKSNMDIIADGSSIIPTKFVLDNYIQAWQVADFAKYTWNSVYMTFFIVAGCIITILVTAYVFERGDFPGKKLCLALVISSMFVSLGSLTLYPVYAIARTVGMNRSLWGVIIIRVFGLDVSILLVARSFIHSIPREIDEAARIDGCSFFKTFYRIIFPLCKPLIATVAILEFRTAWNDYLMPMVFTMSNPDRMPLSVGIINLKNAGESASSWNLMLAGAMIALIPMLLVYIFFNRYFIEGLTSGAVKG